MRIFTGVSWKVGQIRRLLKKKPYMTLQDAAAKLGCSREWVRRLKNRFNLPFKKRPPDHLCWVCGKGINREGGLHHKCARNPMAVASRFWARVGARDYQDKDACWEWQGATHPTYGYGWFGRSASAGPTYTHRIAWELSRGLIPKGMCVLHRCDNPSCVRPDHLFLGTRADNAHDRDRKGRRVSTKGWRKKVCKRGHDRTDPANICEYTIKSGPQKGTVQRYCRECLLASSKSRKSRQKKKSGFSAALFLVSQPALDT